MGLLNVALSLSNLSPLNVQEGRTSGKMSARKKRPSLPRLSSFAAHPRDEPEHPELAPPIPDDESTSASEGSTPSTGVTSPSKQSGEDEEYGGLLQNRVIPSDDKLKAIAEEFGDIAGLHEGAEPERMLAEAKGSLFKWVPKLNIAHVRGVMLIVSSCS